MTTATTTLPVLLGVGIHSARPAASAVGSGGLYSCTTHSLVYQTDGSSWTTWATLGAAASGSITASGYTQSTAKMLGRSTASTGAIEEIAVGTGLTLSAGTLAASGGGGLAQSFLGYNTAGGTWETVTGKREYMKKVTLGATSTFQSIDAYLRPSTDNVIGMAVGILTDNAGSPDIIIAASGLRDGEFYLSNSASMPGAGRWVSIPIGATLAAGDYWLAVMVDLNRVDIAKDGSGSDRYFTSSLFAISGTYPSVFTVTTSTDKYSIRASILA